MVAALLESPRQAYPNAFIWGGRDAQHGELWVTCENGCCASGEFAGSVDLPKWWRYATEAEVAEHNKRIEHATILRNSVMDDLEPQGLVS